MRCCIVRKYVTVKDIPFQLLIHSFEITGISDDTTNQYFNIFMDTWNQSVPLTEELYNELYDA